MTFSSPSNCVGTPVLPSFHIIAFTNAPQAGWCGASINAVKAVNYDLCGTTVRAALFTIAPYDQRRLMPSKTGRV